MCDANVGLDRYPSNSFNVVQVRYVLQGVEDYPSFFRQVARLLRPGGICISIEPTPAAFDAEKNRINATKPSDLVGHQNVFGSERLTSTKSITGLYLVPQASNFLWGGYNGT